MTELINQYQAVFVAVLIVLGLLLCCCLIKACLGPTVADRLVAVNMMGTIVIVIIGILAIVMQEGYLVDICIIYAAVSFLAVIVLTKVIQGIYKEEKQKEGE